MLQYVFSDFTVLVKIKSSTAKPVFFRHRLIIYSFSTVLPQSVGSQEVLVVSGAHLRDLTDAGPSFVIDLPVSIGSPRV